MNDKCAAGTGKFLEYTAKALEIPIEDLGDLALNPVIRQASQACARFSRNRK